MDWLPGPGDAQVRVLVQRGLGAVYLIAFVAARNQFRGLLGSRGLTPVARFVERVPFRRAPSVFHLDSSDRVFAAVAWTGIALSVVAVSGVADTAPLPVVMAIWAVLWAAYLSIVNVGQIWYGFGWESLLVEAGFLAIFLGPADVELPVPVIALFWWLLLRVELGAGLIKMRGDPCWRRLTCLDHHHETQPMPNPLSWYFHHLPKRLHRVEVAANHVAQLVAPFALLAPQPIRTGAAVLIIVTQGWLVLSGNFAWLNVLTIVVGLAALDGGFLEAVSGWEPAGGLDDLPLWFEITVWGLVAVVAFESWGPVRNMASSRQRMNTSFNGLRLVNSYGAFGTVTRRRDEIVIEGTSDPDPGPDSVWLEYEFKGKPGDPSRRPRQWAPYHLRLDWLMWFVPLSPAYGRGWFDELLDRLAARDPAVTSLLRRDPFADGDPPGAVRARLVRYRFTTPGERRETGAWWHREPVGGFAGPVRSRPDAAA